MHNNWDSHQLTWLVHFPLLQPQVQLGHFSRCHGYLWPLVLPSFAHTCYTWIHTTEKLSRDWWRNRQTGNYYQHINLSSPLIPPYREYCVLTAPRSTMKQSPLLKLVQLRGTWVALMTLRPLMWRSLCAERSLVTTWWKPEATPPVWATQTFTVYFRL